jgi:hypothetical protein
VVIVHRFDYRFSFLPFFKLAKKCRCGGPYKVPISGRIYGGGIARPLSIPYQVYFKVKVHSTTTCSKRGEVCVCVEK